MQYNISIIDAINGSFNYTMIKPMEIIYVSAPYSTIFIIIMCFLAIPNFHINDYIVKKLNVDINNKEPICRILYRPLKDDFWINISFDIALLFVLWHFFIG
jgi:hypothetical protein